MIRIYGHPLSTCTRKVLMTLAETNTPYELTVVDFAKGEHKQPAHLTRQPFGQVPAIDDDAIVLHRASRVDAAAELDAPAKPRSDARGDEIGVPILAVIVMLRPSHELLALAELRRDDVVQPADLIAPAAGQPGIGRRGDAVRLVIGAFDQQIIGGVDRAEISSWE